MALDMAIAYREPYAPPVEEPTAIGRGANPGQKCLGSWPRLPETWVLLPPLQTSARHIPAPREPAVPLLPWKEVKSTHIPSFAHTISQISSCRGRPNSPAFPLPREKPLCTLLVARELLYQHGATVPRAPDPSIPAPPSDPEVRKHLRDDRELLFLLQLVPLEFN